MTLKKPPRWPIPIVVRITNNMIERQALSTLQRNLSRVVSAQAQVSSGLRVQVVSDDPTAASQSLGASSSLRAIVQYRRNIDSARSRARQEDSILDAASSLLMRAKELGVSQGGTPATDQSRQTAKAEVDQLLAQMVSLGNARSGDAYLFGGFPSQNVPFQSLTPPFIVAPAPSGQAGTEISSGEIAFANHSGQQVFLDSGVLQSLYDLSQGLGNNDSDAIKTSLSSMDSAFDAVQRLIGETGATENQLDIAGANLDALEGNLKALVSNLTEADTERAVTELVTRQTTYQAAMLATSRVLSLTLTDYLR